jgi:hypothetical protein
MPKVVDTARVTTRESAVWRTCSGCGLLAPLPPGIDRCPVCDRPATRDFADRHTSAGWERAHRYAGLLGRIEAWAVLIPHVSDAERLTHIREALAALNDPAQAAGRS